jgi:hypothetical protein
MLPAAEIPGSLPICGPQALALACISFRRAAVLTATVSWAAGRSASLQQPPRSHRQHYRLSCCFVMCGVSRACGCPDAVRWHALPCNILQHVRAPTTCCFRCARARARGVRLLHFRGSLGRYPSVRGRHNRCRAGHEMRRCSERQQDGRSAAQRVPVWAGTTSVHGRDGAVVHAGEACHGFRG